MPRRYTLGIKGFEQWLAEQARQGDTCIVGQVGSTCGCPLARYLMAQGEDAPVVSRRYYDTANGPKVTPAWAQDFIRLVDGQGGGVIGRPVTVADARGALVVAKMLASAS